MNFLSNPEDDMKDIDPAVPLGIGVGLIVTIALVGLISLILTVVAILKLSDYKNVGGAVALLVIFGIFPFPLQPITAVIACVIIHKANKKSSRIFGMKRSK